MYEPDQQRIVSGKQLSDNKDLIVRLRGIQKRYGKKSMTLNDLNNLKNELEITLVCKLC